MKEIVVVESCMFCSKNQSDIYPYYNIKNNDRHNFSCNYIVRNMLFFNKTISSKKWLLKIHSNVRNKFIFCYTVVNLVHFGKIYADLLESIQTSSHFREIKDKFLYIRRKNNFLEVLIFSSKSLIKNLKIYVYWSIEIVPVFENVKRQQIYKYMNDTLGYPQYGTLNY